MIQRFRSSSPRRFSKARAEADLLRECLGPAELGGEKFRSLTKAALITVFSAWRWLGSLPRRCGTCGPISGPDLQEVRADVRALETRMAAVEHGQARLEDLLEGLREAIVGRRVPSDAA